MAITGTRIPEAWSSTFRKSEMRFQREILMDKAEDCTWLKSTHLKGAVKLPEFRAFTLVGNEDSPTRLDLYVSAKPAYNERPAVVFAVDGEGNLVQQAKVKK